MHAYPTKILRSKRKTLSLEVNRNAELLVRAPIFLQSIEINQFIEKRKSWIINKMREAREGNLLKRVKTFSSGEKFLFMGKEYELEITANKTPALYFEGKFILSQRCINKAREMFVDWYKSQAKKIFYSKVHYFSQSIGTKFHQVKVNSARTRWGSCSYNGNISFPWRLILAPEEVIDYVVVHEVCHLEIKNHSREFWQKIDKLFPDYQKQKRWLRDNGHLLVI